MAFKTLYDAGIFGENGGECLWAGEWEYLWRGLWTKRVIYEVVMKREFGSWVDNWGVNSGFLLGSIWLGGWKSRMIENRDELKKVGG